MAILVSVFIDELFIVFPPVCLKGHFCSRGATVPDPVSQTFGDVCPLGHYCPEGSGSPRPCSVGSYLPERGAPSPSRCYPCPPGRYCLNPGSSQFTGVEKLSTLPGVFPGQVTRGCNHDADSVAKRFVCCKTFYNRNRLLQTE